MIYLGNSTYRLTVGNHIIDFKSIPAEFSETVYNTIVKNENPYFVEFLFNKITEDKYDVEELEAGIIINVIFSALKLSGTFKKPIDVPIKIEETREELSKGLYYSIFSSIVKVLPLYKLEELKTKTTNELMELLVFAEKVLGKEIFDTKKLRESFKEIDEPKTKSTRRGAAAVSKEDIDFLNAMLSKEERDGPGF